MATTRTEARITTANNVLVLLSSQASTELASSFCGSVVNGVGDLPDLTGRSVYLVGDLGEALARKDSFEDADRVFAVNAPTAADTPSDWITIGEGQVPLLWHGVGVYYRRFFPTTIDYFDAIETEHNFQSLTESTKPTSAKRTGLYLTPVDGRDDGLHFRLLRCSTNLSGPTEGFGAVDTSIVRALNEEARHLFANAAPLNHVLAQIYPNTAATTTQKQSKAAIKSHADKTKDMPEDGVMAFCTFYDGLDRLEPIDGHPFDYGYKSTSGLTRLGFRLKETVTPAIANDLPDKFEVTLHPNSVFFMPLSTNRLYTHAIRPSQLDASQLPTRMGYVVRCSATEAVHREGETFLKVGSELQKLVPATAEGIDDLKRLYAEENRTDAFIDYGGRFDFSMNSGDYEAPSPA